MRSVLVSYAASLLWLLLVFLTPIIAATITRCSDCGRPRRRRTLLSDAAGDDYHRIIDRAVQHGLDEALALGLRQEVDAVGWRWVRLYAVECPRCRTHWLQAGRRRGVVVIPWPDEHRHPRRLTTAKQVEILRWAIEGDYLERRMAAHRRNRPWTAADTARAKKAIADLRASSAAKAAHLRAANQPRRLDGGRSSANCGCVVYEEEGGQRQQGTSQN